MTVGIVKIHATAAIVPIRFPWLLFVRVRPILDSAISQIGHDSLEVIFAHKKGVMLPGNFALLFTEIK